MSSALTKRVRVSLNRMILKPIALINSVEQLVLGMVGVKLDKKSTILKGIRVFA